MAEFVWNGTVIPNKERIEPTFGHINIWRIYSAVYCILYTNLKHYLSKTVLNSRGWICYLGGPWIVEDNCCFLRGPWRVEGSSFYLWRSWKVDGSSCYLWGNWIVEGSSCYLRGSWRVEGSSCYPGGFWSVEGSSCYLGGCWIVEGSSVILMKWNYNSCIGLQVNWCRMKRTGWWGL